MYVEEGGPADLAGLRDSDRLLGVVGGDAHLSARRQLSQALDDRPATLRLRVAGEDGSERTVDVPLEWKPDGPKLIGVAPLSNFVLGVRGGGPLADAVPEGARLAEVRGRRVTNGVEFLAAVRDGEPGAPTTLVLRDGSSVDLTDAFERHLASRASPTEGALDVALGADTTTTITAPSEDGGAFAAGVVAGDRIAAIDGKDVANWSELIERAQAAIARGGTVDVTVERDGALITYGVEPRALTTAVTGFAVDGPGTPNFSSIGQNPLEAFTVGLASARRCSSRSGSRSGRSSPRRSRSEHRRDLIRCDRVPHTAKQGPSKLFWHLLSPPGINLAVLGVLPIPVLRGGHYPLPDRREVEGQARVPERVLGYSQLVGFVMIVELSSTRRGTTCNDGCSADRVHGASVAERAPGSRARLGTPRPPVARADRARGRALRSRAEHRRMAGLARRRPRSSRRPAVPRRHGINDWADREHDALTRPDQPIPSGALMPRRCPR
ncbi:MAG: site-2 protease family protein [Planctomycetota bacterium]